MLKIFLVFIGGGLGATLRYLLTIFLSGRIGNFPFGTLVINIIGCFVMGVAFGFFAGKPDAEAYRVFITVGFLGGFTTLSAFFAETLALASEGQFLFVTISTFGNLFVAFFACVLGLKLTHFL